MTDDQAVAKTIITGWCNVQEGHPPPLHHLCHGLYTSKNDVVYVCGCPCHRNGERPVHRVQRRTAEERPVHRVQRRPR